jgi:hypothetical protein
MLWVRKSILTEQIYNADKRVDNALTAIRSQVRALEFSVNTSIKQAATRVYIMLNNYGDVANKPYEQQIGDITAILKQITTGGAYYADIATLSTYTNYLPTLVSELSSAFTLLKNLITERGAKNVTKPDKTFKEVRREIEKIYHKIVIIINAGDILGASDAFTVFINHLNAEIELLNEEFHRIQYDISKAEPEPVEPKAYTGKPITFIPKVLYVTTKGTVQLELGKDFDIVFKNNVNVGNATCNIHGKGAYKGKKIITFIIKRI